MLIETRDCFQSDVTCLEFNRQTMTNEYSNLYQTWLTVHLFSSKRSYESKLWFENLSWSGLKSIGQWGTPKKQKRKSWLICKWKWNKKYEWTQIQVLTMPHWNWKHWVWNWKKWFRLERAWRWKAISFTKVREDLRGKEPCSKSRVS